MPRRGPLARCIDDRAGGGASEEAVADQYGAKVGEEVERGSSDARCEIEFAGVDFRGRFGVDVGCGIVLGVQSAGRIDFRVGVDM